MHSLKNLRDISSQSVEKINTGMNKDNCSLPVRYKEIPLSSLTNYTYIFGS